ncbi:MBOAT family O-acyltransferase [Xanthobacter agilis]|uniref:Probable alginate O-acetylase AlgI n=1 Tax=Xanthobacter agilis TaxID=47492 RepID=A0ABU0LF27_XANAG|nr:MBOAT family O-acyltransferase [Xanthobacter agilis]MDQ0505741.1 alginate O-acetyltransferase complex protein AlgI [Xanthobacter agilis]
MVFASDSFLFLFLPVFLIAYALTPGAARNLAILAFSWLFYAWWRADFLPLIVSIALWSWATGLWIARAAGPARHTALLVGIAWPLVSLIWFKYANMLVATGQAVTASVWGWEDVLLPIGLSFFVFGAISYSVDVFRRTVPAEPSFVNYATYQSMFGHLVAGPVVRYKWVAERLKARTFQRQEFMFGVERFMLGFAQKVLIADTLAPLVDAGYALAHPTTADVALAVTGYTLQLYFDFCGYSAMAIGLGLMVGLKFPENFDNPYLSASLSEFWRRWHISLSSWLRDYLYIPLGGNRGSTGRTSANLILTMGLGGLWHGASWTFLAWGLWHGLGLMAGRVWTARGLPAIGPLLGHGLTLVFVMAGWALFRAQSWGEAATIFTGLAGANGVALSPAMGAAVRPVEILALAVGIGFVYLPKVLRIDPAAPEPGHALRAWLALPLFLFAVLVLQGRTVVPFLYFQF